MAPATMARAAERVEMSQAAKIAARRGYEPVENPLLAMQQLAGEALAVKDQLAELRERESTGSAAYERSFTMAAKIVTDMSRMALDERLARISESQQERMVEALLSTVMAVAERLGHDPLEPATRQILLDELRRTQKALSGAPDLRRPAIGG